MEFPHEYFQDEVREGFYISGLVKRSWAAQLEVLDEVDKLCKKYDMKWVLDAGALLGAVRHGGMLAWDDDIDICMLREDYERFRDIAEKELPRGYECLNLHKQNTLYEFSMRIVNSGKIDFSDEFLKKYNEFPYVAGIDITPLDYLSNDFDMELLREDITAMLFTAIAALENDDEEELENMIGQLSSLYDIELYKSETLRQQLYIKAEELCLLFNADEATNVAKIPCLLQYNKDKFRLKSYQNSIMLPFGSMFIPAPVDYHDVLTAEYGMYMKIIRSSSAHVYPFFSLQLDILKEKIGYYPFKYIFDIRDLNNDDRLPANDARKCVEDFLIVIDRLHNEIIKLLYINKYEKCLETLKICQKSAINTGIIIENCYGEEHISVKTLEDYCEAVYELYVILQGELDDVACEFMCNKLKVLYERVEDSIKTNIKKEIIFMPFRSCYWDAMKSVWSKACEDEMYDVYVVPVPYYERTADGELRNMHYEGDLFPDDVSVTGYDDYDFEKRHPDIIVIQVPYDDCNYTMSVHPFFYSKNLKQYTEKLVYIPFFELNDEYGANIAEQKTMEYFCTVPGLMYADNVIVQSNQMRDTYIECLCDFAGENTRNIWEKKISGAGTPLSDVRITNQIREKENILANINTDCKQKLYKTDEELKKIIMCVTSVASFIHYGEQALHNTEKFFSFVKDHAKDVVLLWMWYPNNPKNSEGDAVSVPLLEQLLEKYKEEDWVIYDDTANIQRGSVLCDGYYGDPCFGGHKCEILGKPVAYMNYEAVEKPTDENDEIELMQGFYADVLNYKIDNNEQEYCVGKKIWDEIKI